MFIEPDLTGGASSVGAAPAWNPVSMPLLRSWRALDCECYRHGAPTTLINPPRKGGVSRQAALRHIRHLAVSLLALVCSVAAQDDATFEASAPREVIVRPAAQPAPSLAEARVEPTRRERRSGGEFDIDVWTQDFTLAYRLPIAEPFALRQEFRAGVQAENGLFGDEFEAALRDAVTIAERTAALLQLTESFKAELSVQDQWLAQNSVPFAEIVTYGAEAAWSPAKQTQVKARLALDQREEATGGASGRQTVRLAIEQEFVPARVKASAAASVAHQDDALVAEKEARIEKIEAALKWTPFSPTTFALHYERGEKTLLTLDETEFAQLYGFKLQQQLFPQMKLELNAAHDARLREALDSATRTGTWNLGASSDLTLLENWNAGVGIRYRFRDDTLLTAPPEELSLTLSLKGKF